MPRLVIFLALLSLTLAACASTSKAPPPTAPLPTEILRTSAPLPTDTPVPAATLAPTAPPEDQIFRDDFSEELQLGWTWKNENP